MFGQGQSRNSCKRESVNRFVRITAARCARRRQVFADAINVERFFFFYIYRLTYCNRGELWRTRWLVRATRFQRFQLLSNLRSLLGEPFRGCASSSGVVASEAAACLLANTPRLARASGFEFELNSLVVGTARYGVTFFRSISLCFPKETLFVLENEGGGKYRSPPLLVSRS